MSITILASNDPIVPLAGRSDPTTTIVFEDRNDLATKLIAMPPSAERTIDLVGLTAADHMVTFHGRPLDTHQARACVLARARRSRHLGTARDLHAAPGGLPECDRQPRTDHDRGARRDLELDVVGTTELVSLADFGPDGFMPPQATQTGGHYLDLDALAARLADEGAQVVTAAVGHDVLPQVRRNHGIAMPDLLARAHATLAIPSARNGLFHHVEVLLDHELVRTGGVVFHVDDPRALRRLVDA